MSNNTEIKISTSPHLQYRKDINGLRGIAILFVVISHGWWSTMPSGKVGVDIFFVISGYLISSIIFRERSKGVYTIWKFYSRRIKRITPALILFLGVMIFFIPDSYFQNDKVRMRQEGSHMMASILMVQNLEHIRMDFNNQYNSTVTTHLWSLGIQEQFYIFWPLVTGMIMKLNVKKGSIAIIGLICLSFLIQLTLEIVYVGWRTCRYVPFAKFWQFLVGCLLAYVQYKMKEGDKNIQQRHQIFQQNDSISKKQQTTNISSGVQEQVDKNQPTDLQKPTGSELKQFIQHSSNKEVANYIKRFATRKNLLRILLQIIPFVCFYILYITGRVRIILPHINNRDLQHAGFYYVPSVLATGILIITKESYFNKKILGNKVLQFFGDISYPLYLWHGGLQMLFLHNNVLGQIYAPAIAISYVSNEYIEPIFRRNQRKWVIPFLVLAQIIIFWRAYELYRAYA